MEHFDRPDLQDWAKGIQTRGARFFGKFSRALGLLARSFAHIACEPSINSGDDHERQHRNGLDSARVVVEAFQEVHLYRPRRAL